MLRSSVAALMPAGSFSGIALAWSDPTANNAIADASVVKSWRMHFLLKGFSLFVEPAMIPHKMPTSHGGAIHPSFMRGDLEFENDKGRPRDRPSRKRYRSPLSPQPWRPRCSTTHLP